MTDKSKALTVRLAEMHFLRLTAEYHRVKYIFVKAHEMAPFSVPFMMKNTEVKSLGCKEAMQPFILSCLDLSSKYMRTIKHSPLQKNLQETKSL